MSESTGFNERIAEGLKKRWPGAQAIVVLAKRGNAPEAQMWLYERESSGWKVSAGPWPAAVGMNGTGKRAEGDGKSPSGAFLLGAAFGRTEKPLGLRCPYRELDSKDLWVDNPASPFYNRWVRGAESVCGTGEVLSKIEPYRYAVAVHANDGAVPGAGSAIFLHIWKAPGQGTAGCTAISEENMLSLLEWLDYDKRPVLVQGTTAELERLMAADWSMLCLPPGWGFIDDFIPDAQLEIRYNSRNNFTGGRIPGYAASVAPLRVEAIGALAHATDDLRRQNLGIRIYDAYRPQCASDAMIAWAEDEADTATKAGYYPEIEKAEIPHGFVARKSAHKLGGTVDLTLVDWATGLSLDMGGPFDFFGERSAYGYGGLTPVQQASRALLRDALMKNGFKPYDKEWWHFTYPVEGDGGDFLIVPREHPLR
jgi:D-alanyl-D-alanine dipeptidase